MFNSYNNVRFCSHFLGKIQNGTNPVPNSCLTTPPQSFLLNIFLGQSSQKHLGMHGRFWHRNDPTVSTGLYSS